jgi:hypothetical protein
MKPGRIFVFVALAAVVLLTATCVASTPAPVSPTKQPGSQATIAPTKSPTKSPQGQPASTSSPAPKFVCTTQGSGASTQRVCTSVEITDPSKSVKVIIRGNQAQTLTVEGRPVEPTDALSILLSKTQDNFKPNPARIVTNFEVMDQEKKQPVRSFNPPIEVWMQFNDADVKFAEGTGAIRMAFPDQAAQKWLVFGSKSGQKAVVEGNYIYVSGISSWSDPPIVAGDCGIMKYKEPDGKYNCKQ